MTIATDTDDLLAVWGETVKIRRNTPSISSSTGDSSDSWADAGTVSADIQPYRIRKDGNPATQIGQAALNEYTLYFPNGTDVRQGDRIQPAGWAAGNDEYEVNSVLAEEGHVETICSMVKGHG